MVKHITQNVNKPNNMIYRTRNAKRAFAQQVDPPLRHYLLKSSVCAADISSVFDGSKACKRFCDTISNSTSNTSDSNSNIKSKSNSKSRSNGKRKSDSDDKVHTRGADRSPGPEKEEGERALDDLRAAAGVVRILLLLSLLLLLINL